MDYVSLTLPDSYAEWVGQWVVAYLPSFLRRTGPFDLRVWQWLALPLLMLVAWGVGAGRILWRVLHRGTDHPLGVRASKILVLVLAIVAILSAMGFPVTSVIVGLGIGGLALGGLAIALAAQKTVENLFGAFSLGVDQPFREGDFAKIEDFVGTVETIGLRSTRIRTLDRTIITMPNGKLADMRLESFTVRDRLRLATVVGLTYDTTPSQMREILHQLERVLRAHPKIWPDAVVVKFREFTSSSLDIEIMAWFQTPDWGEFQRSVMANVRVILNVIRTSRVLRQRTPNGMPVKHVPWYCVALITLWAQAWTLAGAQSLRGSRASVNRMARYAEHHDLYAYQTRKGILTAAHHHRLVRLDGSSAYQLYDVAYPFVRPAAKLFVERLSRQYSAACGDTLVVTSAIRPARAQPWNSVARSVHPTGIAVDLRKPLRSRCRTWLRETLLTLERTGVLEATEEFGPPHFHVAVYGVPYRAYVASLTTPSNPADGPPAKGHSSTDVSAHAIRRRIHR